MLLLLKPNNNIADDGVDDNDDDVPFSFAEGKSDKEILDHLLKGTRYDKRLLPPVDGKCRPFLLPPCPCFFCSLFSSR